MSILQTVPALKGCLSASKSLQGTLTCKQQLTGKLTIPNKYDEYVGMYDVTPKAFMSQTLETENKLMQNNVTVACIPYYETGNQFGTTIYIADRIL